MKRHYLNLLSAITLLTGVCVTFSAIASDHYVVLNRNTSQENLGHYYCKAIGSPTALISFINNSVKITGFNSSSELTASVADLNAHYFNYYYSYTQSPLPYIEITNIPQGVVIHCVDGSQGGRPTVYPGGFGPMG